MFRWIDSEELDAEALQELLGIQTRPLPSHKAIARALLFVPSLTNYALRRGGELPEPEFLATTAASLRHVWDGVVDIRDTTRQLVRELVAPVQWRQALEQRTGLQVLADWYAAHMGELVESLRLDELDAEMRDRAQATGFAREANVPPGVPASHWWWNLP